VGEENRGMTLKLEKQRFFNEWQLMLKEYEGAKAFNARVKTELEKKRAEI
jgi:hypothetical protein